MRKTAEVEINFKKPASLLTISLWDIFQFLLLQMNHVASPYVGHRLHMGYSKQLVG